MLAQASVSGSPLVSRKHDLVGVGATSVAPRLGVDWVDIGGDSHYHLAFASG